MLVQRCIIHILCKLNRKNNFAGIQSVMISRSFSQLLKFLCKLKELSLKIFYFTQPNRKLGLILLSMVEYKHRLVQGY